MVGVEQYAAGSDVFGTQGRHGVQLCGNVEAAGVDYLVAGGFFGVGGQAVVFQGIAGQPRDVFHGQVQHGVLGYGRMAVADDPTLVEIGGAFGGDAGGDFVERLRDREVIAKVTAICSSVRSRGDRG